MPCAVNPAFSRALAWNSRRLDASLIHQYLTRLPAWLPRPGGALVALVVSLRYTRRRSRQTGVGDGDSCVLVLARARVALDRGLDTDSVLGEDNRRNSILILALLDLRPFLGGLWGYNNSA